MITCDYHRKPINPEELQDLKEIADVGISDITLDDYPNLLVFPDSFERYDRDFGKKVICNIGTSGKDLYTNSIVGFIGRNKTHLSIHSRFANDGEEDYFLHYMLQKVARINLFSLQHTTDEDSVFDFLLYLFPLYLKKAINQGIYKQYITRKYNDANVKGVIDINRHIRNNEPFNGRIAYNSREYSYDNDVTQLIRHTIEFIKGYKGGGDILNIDTETHQAVAQMISATPSYVSNKKENIINRNLRPIAHPYYSEYAPLQRLCLQILRHEELKYGQKENEIYGVLIDAAWLWEEYLALILEGKFSHYLKDKGKRFYLFKNNQDVNIQQIVPDYLSLDKKEVADAKYIPLNRESWYGEEKATSIYYKTITYMYRFCSNKGYLFFPYPDKETSPIDLKINTEIDGVNGGILTKLGLRIPSGCNSYSRFTSLMNKYEQDFLNSIIQDRETYNSSIICVTNNQIIKMSDKYIRFGDHFLVLGDVEEFVNWLIDESDLSDEEKIKELEYQSTWQIGNDTVFLSAISRLRSPNDWPAVCSQCGHYCYSGEYVEIQVGFNVHTHREVISRSLFGGSTVRRITETATPIVKTFCNRCADDYYRRCKEEAEKRSLKGLFKRVFKKNK